MLFFVFPSAKNQIRGKGNWMAFLIEQNLIQYISWRKLPRFSLQTISYEFQLQNLIKETSPWQEASSHYFIKVLLRL